MHIFHNVFCQEWLTSIFKTIFNLFFILLYVLCFVIFNNDSSDFTSYFQDSNLFCKMSPVLFIHCSVHHFVCLYCNELAFCLIKDLNFNDKSFMSNLMTLALNITVVCVYRQSGR